MTVIIVRNRRLTQRNMGNKRGRKYFLKVATMLIGVLIGTCALAGVASAFAIVCTQMDLLEDVTVACMEWGKNAHANITSAAPSPPPPMLASRHGAIGNPAPERGMHTFTAVLGVLIVSLGIPNIVHFIISAQLVFGAWRERRNAVVQWIWYTQKTTAFHFLLTVFIVVALMALNKKFLAAVLTGVLVAITGVVVFFLSIVSQYNCILHNRPLPSVIFRNDGTVTIQ